MKTLKEITSEIDALEYMNGSLYENEPLEEGLAAASAIYSKLSRWKDEIAYETNIQKQLEIIAAMLHFGLSTIALASNKGEENEVT